MAVVPIPKIVAVAKPLGSIIALTPITAVLETAKALVTAAVKEGKGIAEVGPLCGVAAILAKEVVAEFLGAGRADVGPLALVRPRAIPSLVSWPA